MYLRRQVVEGCGLRLDAGGSARNDVQNASDSIEADQDRRRRDLAVHELHQLLPRVAERVKGAHPRQDVEKQAKRDLEREALTRLRPRPGGPAGRAVVEAPQRTELFAFDEITEDDDVRSPHHHLAHAHDVLIGERRDAPRLAPEIGAAVVARADEALSHDDRCSAASRRRVTSDVHGKRTRPEFADNLVRRESILIDLEPSGTSHHGTESTLIERARIVEAHTYT